LISNREYGAVSPGISFEPSRRQLGVAHRMLDRLVAKIGLDRLGIDTVVGQLEPAGVAEHVRVDLHIEASSLASALDHRLKAALGEGRAAFRSEHEW
jgi:hypothetical protein